MKQWAEGLTPAQINGVAFYLTGQTAVSPPPSAINDNLCKESAPPLTLNELQWNGWGRDLDNSRYQPKPVSARRRAETESKVGLASSWSDGHRSTDDHRNAIVCHNRSRPTLQFECRDRLHRIGRSKAGAALRSA
jgi:hypothetical protein